MVGGPKRRDRLPVGWRGREPYAPSRERANRHEARCRCGGEYAGGGSIAAGGCCRADCVFAGCQSGRERLGRELVASWTNLTGFTNFEPTMGGKWLELLKEIAPGVTRAIAIFNPETHSGQYWQSVEAAAKTLAVEFNRAPVRDAAGIESAVARLAREPNGGALVMPHPFTLAQRELIVALTARHRLPSISPFRVFTANGGLLSYGPDMVEIYWRVASYVDRILKGEKPADLPVQAPKKFELIVNLKTARALGLD